MDISKRAHGVVGRWRRLARRVFELSAWRPAGTKCRLGPGRATSGRCGSARGAPRATARPAPRARTSAPCSFCSGERTTSPHARAGPQMMFIFSGEGTSRGCRSGRHPHDEGSRERAPTYHRRSRRAVRFGCSTGGRKALCRSCCSSTRGCGSKAHRDKATRRPRAHSPATGLKLDGEDSGDSYARVIGGEALAARVLVARMLLFLCLHSDYHKARVVPSEG